MPDNLLVIRLILVFLKKICRSRKGDLVDIFLHFICCHPKSVVCKSNRLILRIYLYIDFRPVIIRQLCLSDQ